MSMDAILPSRPKDGEQQDSSNHEARPRSHMPTTSSEPEIGMDRTNASFCNSPPSQTSHFSLSPDESKRIS